MSNLITVIPTTGASTNPLGITFGSTAIIEFLRLPEKLINKDISNLELSMVDTVGAYIQKGALKALLPWSSILSFIY